MDQIIEFFQFMFSTADWPPRWICGEWSEFHGWLYIGSDIGIWVAYFIIPVILFWFIQQRPNAPFPPVFWLFGAFIILCGATHLMDALIFWWPGYRISALLRFFTAVVSLITVFALIRELPKALEIMSFKSTALDDPIIKNSTKEDLLLLISKQESEIIELKRQLKQR